MFQHSAQCAEGGRYRIDVRRTGYRISLDPVLLAQFISLQEVDTVMDLGTGNGVLPLILAFMYPSLSITGLEIQTTMGRAIQVLSSYDMLNGGSSGFNYRLLNHR